MIKCKIMIDIEMEYELGEIELDNIPSQDPDKYFSWINQIAETFSEYNKIKEQFCAKYDVKSCYPYLVEV